LLTPTLALLLAAASAPPIGPGTRFDPRIPTLEQVVGHATGEAITSPEGVHAYLAALAAAAPDRARLVEYARSEEGRPLEVLVIGSPERIARIDDVKTGLRALADPRTLAPAEADRLLRDLATCRERHRCPHGRPIVVRLAHAEIERRIGRR